MDDEELESGGNAAKTSKTLGCDLSLMGVEELKVYVAELQDEIDRVHSEIITKEAVRSQAEAFFRSS